MSRPTKAKTPEEQMKIEKRKFLNRIKHKKVLAERIAAKGKGEVDRRLFREELI